MGSTTTSNITNKSATVLSTRCVFFLEYFFVHFRKRKYTTHTSYFIFSYLLESLAQALLRVPSRDSDGETEGICKNVVLKTSEFTNEEYRIEVQFSYFANFHCTQIGFTLEYILRLI